MSDRIFGKGEINITLDHGINAAFDYISDPKYVATLLWDKKAQFESKHTPMLENPNNPFESHNNEKFDILVETLGEVIKDYMDKDKKKDNPDRWSM